MFAGKHLLLRSSGQACAEFIYAKCKKGIKKIIYIIHSLSLKPFLKIKETKPKLFQNEPVYTDCLISLGSYSDNWWGEKKTPYGPQRK